MQAAPARHHPWLPLTLLMIVIPVIVLLLYFSVARSTFELLGLSPQGAGLLLIASVLGSMINIPLTRRRIALADPRLEKMSPAMRQMAIWLHYYPPAVEEQVLALNVGGAVVPIVFSAYLLTRTSTGILDAVIATLAVAVVAKLLARPMPGVGIALPGFIPPIVAALTAVIVVKVLGANAAIAPVAYIAGALGTLIGADLLNLPLVLRGGLLNAGPQRLWRTGPEAQIPNQPRIVSIGGAGVFDGIFLTAVVAPLLASIH